MEGLELLQKAISDMPGNAPLLVMGTAVIDFRKEYKGPIRVVRNTDDVRELVAYYTDIPGLDQPLVIEDLSFLSETASFMLLKLVEESTFPIILLSTYDKVSAIMLSRVKTVVKYQREKTTSEFLPVGKGLKRIDEVLSEDSHIYDRYRYIGKISPMVLYFDKKITKVRNRNKIMELLD